MHIVEGESDLSEYTFASKLLVHKFCTTCGTAVLAKKKGGPLYINMRTLLNVNPFTFKLERFPGEEIGPDYHPPEFKGKLPEYKGEGLKIYTGSCHCGAVTLALKTKPLPQCEIKQDNCSICVRNAYICVYPSLSQVTIDGQEDTTGYRFGKKFIEHRFCRTCGVPVYMKVIGPEEEPIEAWSEERKALVAKNIDMCPINVRVLNDVEWEDLRIVTLDEGTSGYSVE